MVTTKGGQFSEEERCKGISRQSKERCKRSRSSESISAPWRSAWRR